MTSLQPPPLRDLPAGRLEQRKLHLLSEIAEPSSARGSRPSRQWRRRTVGLVAAAVAVVVVGGVAALGSHWGATEASAADVRTSLTQGLSTPRNLRGAFSVQTRPARPRPKPAHGCSNCTPPLPVPSTFVLGSDGSYSSLSRAPTGAYPTSAAFDARADVMTQIGSLGRGLLYVRTTGNNPAFTSFRPESPLATWVLYALDSGDGHVTSTRFEGRDAWALTLDFSPGDDYYDTYGARVDVIVDKETGLVLQLTQYENDPSYWTSIETIHDLELDAPTSRADFTLPIPASARVIEHDQGFEPVTRRQAAAAVGYAPLLPTDTGGRSLIALAAAKKSTIAFLPGMTGPVYGDVVTARYGSGLDAITVSTRRGTRLDVVPELTARTITIGRGLLTGATAYVSNSPTVPGYLAAYHQGLVVEINAPSADDALAAAESLSRG
jgi:hypothetical protein